MPFRAICVTDNPLLRRTLRRTLQAVGSVVEFTDATGILVETTGDASTPDLIVLDAESREGVDVDRLAEVSPNAEVVVVGASLEKDEVLTLLRGGGFNHVISRLGASQIDEDDLVVTSGKMLKGDIFGLEKYLAWGALVHERIISSYEEKRGVLLEIARDAAEVGARRQVVARIESVTDELLMNALYDAPAARHHVAPRISERSRANLGPIGDQPAVLRWACDDRHFAVSVRDNYGELKKSAILDHLARARRMRGLPRSRTDGGGAGLGLYFVIASVTRFIVNVSPGQLTEVVGLFDLRTTRHDQDTCAKSLHIFTTPSDD